MTRALVTTALCLLLPLSAGASPYPLAEILDKATAETLAKEKVVTSDDLLQRGARVKDRQGLAKATKLPDRKLAEWVKMCDLLRIKGVGPEMVKLLNAGRVTTVKQLRGSKAAPLYKRLLEANKKKKITQNPPTEEQLTAWIEHAKKLELVLR
jgi:predicted flap endonuclease-1-like 5' DNA nuclease